MNEFSICDYFKWNLKEVRGMTLMEHNVMKEYFKKLKREQKEMEQKTKMRNRKR